MKNYYGIDLEKQRDAILKCKAIEPRLKNIIKAADDVLEKTYPVIKMSEFMLYYVTGDRKAFEEKYYERRADCANLSAALWLTEDEKYIKPLIDAIYTICDEYTWCLPAHANMDKNPTPEEIVNWIDLANGETARMLTEVAVSNGDKLPRYVNERIAYEIRRRIIEGLKNDRYGWRNSTSNWASVCSCCSATAILHFGTEDEISSVMPVLYKAIDNFLVGYENDGCCKEGINYWTYGFGYFLYFTRLADAYTKGEKNYFEDEKVKNIAFFFQKMRMGGKKAYSTSDSSQRYYTSAKNLSILRKMYGKDILYPEISLLENKGGNIFSITELLWFDTEYKEDVWPYGTAFFADSQLYVRREKNFSFAAKGGTNGEPHNHNDIGSFMIVDKNDDVPITDTGRAVYNKDSFDPQTRYTIFVNGSQGHSVPIINGNYQMPGMEYKARNVETGDDFFSLDIEGAYEEGLINKIHRTFKFCDNSVVLTDEFDYSSKTENICERFISNFEPKIYDHCVVLGNTKILFEKGKYKVDSGSETYMVADGTKTVYYIDFNMCDTRFSIEIKMAE